MIAPKHKTTDFKTQNGAPKHALLELKPLTAGLNPLTEH
jgi:hypothetical protein